MRDVLRTAAAVVLLTLLAVGTAAALVTLPGTWTIAVSHDDNKFVRLELSSDSPGHHDSNSHDVPTAVLNLKPDDLTAAEHAVSFTISRDAGTIRCAGTLAHGNGGGPFEFTPSDAFRSRMHERGYWNLQPNDQLTGAMVDLTTDYVDELAAVGYRHVDYSELVALRANRVDADYLRDLASVGYRELPIGELMALRGLNIDAAYIKRVQAHGFQHLPIEKLIELKATNVISAIGSERNS